MFHYLNKWTDSFVVLLVIELVSADEFERAWLLPNLRVMFLKHITTVDSSILLELREVVHVVIIDNVVMYHDDRKTA